MLPNKTRRWLILGTLLTLSVLGAAQVASESDPPLELASHTRPRQVRPDAFAIKPEATGIDVDADNFYPRIARQEVTDVFAPQSWTLPPEPVATPYVAPAAPPMPFTYLGKLVEGGKTTVFLGRDARNYAVREGDVIDETYRVVAIRGSLIELTYIPLAISQTLATGEHN